MEQSIGGKMKNMFRRYWHYFVMFVVAIMIIIVIAVSISIRNLNQVENEDEAKKIGTLYQISKDEFDYNLISNKTYLVDYMFTEDNNLKNAHITFDLYESGDCKVYISQDSYPYYYSNSNSTQCTYSMQDSNISISSTLLTETTENIGITVPNYIDVPDYITTETTEELNVSGTILDNGRFMQIENMKYVIEEAERCAENDITTLLFDVQSQTVYDPSGKILFTLDGTDYFYDEEEDLNIDPSQYEIVTKPMEEVRNELYADITNLYVDANILENGDMHVKELFVLNGTFHGLIREVVYEDNNLQRHNPVDLSQDAIYNAINMKDIKVKAKKIELNDSSFDLFDDTDYTELTKKNSEEDAKNGDYVESSIQGGKSLKMFCEANNETVAFLVEYTFQDVVVLHNDIAEVYWPFLGSDFRDPLNEVQIKVSLPQEDTREHFRIWAHSNTTGSVKFLDNQTLLVSTKKLPPNTSIDIRATFNKDFVSNIISSKQSGIDALDKILDIEKERATS